MKRAYPINLSNNHQATLIQQTAFHEAGHAASIYLGNKKKGLPPVYFQIEIKKYATENKELYAKVIDGCLIQNLPIAGLNNNRLLSETEQRNYQSAYEADIINLLVGPLAEAKYVSIKDDEIFNFNLITPDALHYYGGSYDVKKAYAYLQYFISSKTQQDKKMLELFSQAYEFISQTKNWKSIVQLANYLIDSDKDIITCEEAIAILSMK